MKREEAGKISILTIKLDKESIEGSAVRLSEKEITFNSQWRMSHKLLEAFGVECSEFQGYRRVLARRKFDPGEVGKGKELTYCLII